MDTRTKSIGIDVAYSKDLVIAVLYDEKNLVFHSIPKKTLPRRKTPTLVQRIRHLTDQFKSIELDFTDGMVCIENFYKHLNIQTTKDLSAIAGVVMAYMIGWNCDIVRKYPSEWKAKILSGNSSKEAFIKYIEKKYKLDNVTDDEADAACMAEFAYYTQFGKLPGLVVDKV